MSTPSSTSSSMTFTLPYNLPPVLTLLTLSVLLAVAIPSILYPTATLRWLRLKRYQYEVTLPLYMMTPMERFIFNSCLFLTLSMIIIACALYLPEHIATISRRAAYYYHGFHPRENHNSQPLASSASSSVHQDEAIKEALKTVASAGFQATRVAGEKLREAVKGQ